MGYYSTLHIELPLEFDITDEKAMIAIEALNECINCKSLDGDYPDSIKIKLLYKDAIPEIFSAKRFLVFFRNGEKNNFFVEEIDGKYVIKGNIKIDSFHKDYDDEIKKFYDFIIPYIDSSIEDGKVVGKYMIEDNEGLHDICIRKHVDGPITIEVKDLEKFHKELQNLW